MKTVLLKKYNSIAEAELAKNVLASQGIKSVVQKQGLVYPANNDDFMGASLMVLINDLAKAEEILG